MNEETARQQCYADKAEANTKSPRPNAAFCGVVCGDERRLEQLVRCYVAEGQLCVFSFFFPPPFFLPLSLLSNAESHDSANPLPLPPHILRYCYDIVTAVAGGGCYGNRVMIGGAVCCQEACWGSWMGG